VANLVCILVATLVGSLVVFVLVATLVCTLVATYLGLLVEFVLVAMLVCTLVGWLIGLYFGLHVGDNACRNIGSINCSNIL
jgi:hypothetical protein